MSATVPVISLAEAKGLSERFYLSPEKSAELIAAVTKHVNEKITTAIKSRQDSCTIGVRPGNVGFDMQDILLQLRADDLVDAPVNSGFSAADLRILRGSPQAMYEANQEALVRRRLDEFAEIVTVVLRKLIDAGFGVRRAAGDHGSYVIEGWSNGLT